MTTRGSDWARLTNIQEKAIDYACSNLVARIGVNQLVRPYPVP
jgi:hypothetical protein